MPLINEADLRSNSLLQTGADTPPDITPVMTPVVDVDYEATYVDLKWQPRTQLLTHIEGSSWVVDYYSQVITKDSALSGIELTTSGVYQSYTLIKSLEIKVSSALSTSQDDQTKAMRVGGSAVIVPVIIPNVGDMFTASIGEGKTAVFRVISSVKKSIFKQSCYEIGYNLDTDASDKKDALKEKTVRTYHYLKNNLLYGKNPLITTSAFSALSSLQTKYRRVMHEYLRMYLSQEYHTLLVGGQVGSKVYDHYHTLSFLRSFGIDDHSDVSNIQSLNMSDDNYRDHHCVWDAVTRQDEDVINTSFTKYRLVSTKLFTRNPLMRSIYYTGIDEVVYPHDPQKNIDEEVSESAKLSDGSLLLETMETVDLPYTSSNVDYGTQLRGVNLSVLNNQSAPIIYPVTQDEYYIFSSHFYLRDEQMSALEQMVLDFIQRKPTDLVQLSEFLSVCSTWGSLERYYYIPFILLMAKTALYSAD